MLLLLPLFLFEFLLFELALEFVFVVFFFLGEDILLILFYFGEPKNAVLVLPFVVVAWVAFLATFFVGLGKEEVLLNLQIHTKRVNGVG